MDIDDLKWMLRDYDDDVEVLVEVPGSGLYNIVRTSDIADAHTITLVCEKAMKEVPAQAIEEEGE